jgi:signal peptidase I
VKTRRGSLLGSAVTVGLLAAWFVLFRPTSLGGEATWIVIRGSSMLPAYRSGDLVVVRAASDYAIGDTVAYRVAPGEIGAGHVVIHRLVGGDGEAGFDVQGDNNTAPDPWHPTRNDVVGRAWIVIPGLGRVVAWIRQPIVAAGLASAIVVVFVVGRGSGPRKPERAGSALAIEAPA